MSSSSGDWSAARLSGAGFRAACLAVSLAVSGCTWQPLYSSGHAGPALAESPLAQVSVGPVESRQAQQVRNHLIFLLQGGRDQADTRYRLQLRITNTGNEFAAVEGIRDFTAGSITITASYDLVDSTTNTRVSGGTRFATATYDRTSQSFANSRAARDAENRAARELAEQLRLAIASDLKA